MRKRAAGVLCCSLFLLLRGAAHSEPLLPATLFTLGETCQKNGRYLEALSFYRDILLNSEPAALPAVLYKNMGDIYYEYLEGYEQALACYRKQVETFPALPCTPDVHLRIARILYLQGLKEQARARYQFICSSFPGYAKKYSIAEEMGRAERAEQPFTCSTVSLEQQQPLHIRVLLKDDAEPAELSAPRGLSFFSDQSARGFIAGRKRRASPLTAKG
jgi:tetratricopeptide (TPR) repeat protein